MLEQGRILGNYRIDGVLGRGGMGVVYEATQISLQRTVALKVIGAEVSADDAFRERFRREGLIQAGLDHPHIVTVFEAGEHDHHLFIAMRLVRGPTLKDMIIGRELDAGRALRILRPIADALDTAHQAGLIHRDIKPQNILVGPRDHAYLADFGLTKATGERGLTRTGQFVGTIDYISPEQISGGEATSRTDIYALGAVLFEALTGVVPYPKPSDAAVLYAHVAEEPPRVSAQRPELPDALDPVIAAAMAKSPGDRPETAAAFLRNAERAFSRPTRAAMKIPGPFEGPEDAGVRRREAHVSTVESRRKDLGPAFAATVPTPAANAPTPVATPRRPAEDAPAGPRRAWLAIVPLLAALAAAGYFGGRAGSSEGETSGTAGFISVGDLRLDAPAGWSPDEPPPSLPGLDLTGPLAVGPAAPAEHGLVAGTIAAAVGPDLLDASFARRLTRLPPQGEPVRIGELEALRYPRLRVRGSARAMTLYAIPTDKGAVTVACYSPAVTPSAAVLAACERAATTLRVSGARTYPIGPDERYADELGDVLAVLERDRTAARARLARATLPATQAGSAQRLATISGRAGNAAARLVVSARDREAHDQLVRALRAGRDSYGRLAAAARIGGPRRYARAATAVRAAERDESAALKALRGLGYRI